MVFEHSFKDLAEEQLAMIDSRDFNQLVESAIYGSWRIVDIDGFFDGNSFFRNVFDV